MLTLDFANEKYYFIYLFISWLAWKLQGLSTLGLHSEHEHQALGVANVQNICGKDRSLTIWQQCTFSPRDLILIIGLVFSPETPELKMLQNPLLQFCYTFMNTPWLKYSYSL